MARLLASASIMARVTGEPDAASCSAAACTLIEISAEKQVWQINKLQPLSLNHEP